MPRLVGYRFLGKASFLLGEAADAEEAYKSATELDKDLLPAWKGLAELYEPTDRDFDKATVLQHLVR